MTAPIVRMAMLEGRCAREAAVQASDACCDTNFLIHEAVRALADNRWLSDMVGNQRKVLGLFRHKSLSVPGRIAESRAEHLAIFAVLKARIG